MGGVAGVGVGRVVAGVGRDGLTSGQVGHQASQVPGNSALQTKYLSLVTGRDRMTVRLIG